MRRHFSTLHQLHVTLRVILLSLVQLHSSTHDLLRVNLDKLSLGFPNSDKSDIVHDNVFFGHSLAALIYT